MTFTLTLVDERTNEEIRLNPQMPKYVFPMSAYFGKESKANLRAAFAPLYADLLEMQRDGLEIEGVRVPLRFIHGNDLSNLWKVRHISRVLARARGRLQL